MAKSLHYMSFMINQIYLGYFKVFRALTLLTAAYSLMACAPTSNDSVQANMNAQPGNQIDQPLLSPMVKPVVKEVTSNFEHPNFPIVNALDGDSDTFMTTFGLNKGDVRIIAFEFESISNVQVIDFEDNYTNQYSLGDLQIQISDNSTDGLDGQWQTIQNLSASENAFIDGDGSVSLSGISTKWIRLRMTFLGTGAYGGSPSFYLSEITFH